MPDVEVPFAELTRLGGFFSLVRKRSDLGWRVGSSLLDDLDNLDDAVADYRRRLGTGREDLAASLLVQGWAARLCAVWVGCVALVGRVPDLAADAVDLRLPPGGALELRLHSRHTVSVQAGRDRLVTGHLAPLIATVHERYRTPRRRLWGNVAAVHAGAVTSARRAGLDAAWDPPPEWARLGRFRDPTAFQRDTCCGLVRVGRPACGDCVLRWRSAVAAAEELP